jgi:hypothetical protein
MTSGRQFRVFAKGITVAGPEVRRSTDWAVARRGWLHIYADRLELGDWVIPYSAIQEATLFRLRTLLGGYVLYVRANGQAYQFGLNPWALLGKQLPFPHAREATRVRHTALTIAVRVVLLLYLLAWATGKLPW